MSGGEQIHLQEALNFLTAAPLIVIVIGFIKGVYEIPRKFLPLLSLGLALLWGVVLIVTDYLNTDPALFIIQAIAVSLTANGIHSTYRTFEPTREEIEREIIEQIEYEQSIDYTEDTE